jgi:hypothetical protein
MQLRFSYGTRTEHCKGALQLTRVCHPGQPAAKLSTELSVELSIVAAAGLPDEPGPRMSWSGPKAEFAAHEISLGAFLQFVICSSAR